MGASTSKRLHITSEECIKTITRYFADHLTQTEYCPNSSFSNHNLKDTKWRYIRVILSHQQHINVNININGKASYKCLNHLELNFNPQSRFQS